MTDPPTVEGPQTSTLVAVAIGALVGIVVVLGGVFDMGLLEIAVLLSPMLVLAALGGLALLCVKRRGGLDAEPLLNPGRAGSRPGAVRPRSSSTCR